MRLQLPIKRPRPNNEVPGLEVLLLLLLVLAIAALNSCCPKIVEKPSVTVQRVESIPITLPPPLVIIPPDSTSITLNLSQLCDSVWKNQHAVLAKSRGTRIRARVEQQGQSITFRCAADSLQHVLDSIQSYAIINHKETESSFVAYQCPNKWPGWVHNAVLITLLILALALVVSRSLRA